MKKMKINWDYRRTPYLPFLPSITKKEFEKFKNSKKGESFYYYSLYHNQCDYESFCKKMWQGMFNPTELIHLECIAEIKGYKSGWVYYKGLDLGLIKYSSINYSPHENSYVNHIGEYYEINSYEEFDFYRD